MIFPEIQEIHKNTLKEALDLSRKIVDAFNEDQVLNVEHYYKMNDIYPIPENAKEYRWESPSDFSVGKREEEPKYGVYAADPKKITEGD